jgi:hypothetical protein
VDRGNESGGAVTVIAGRKDIAPGVEAASGA